MGFFDSLEKSFDVAKSVTRGTDGQPAGFTDLATFPAPSGSDLRQARIANERNAVAKRQMMRWFLPELGIVQMYINPKSVKYTDKKHIPTPTRTRSGYLIQYWGEDLGSVSISGTTGSSGVEGINVLYDVYRNEQVAMDGLALAAEAAREKQAEQQGLASGAIGPGTLLGAAGDLLNTASDSLFDQVNNVLQTGSINPTTPKPTLASIAFQTEMYWSGWVFRGYFNSMTVNESSDMIGLFDYTMEFTVTQKRGLRLNFMPWHRSAVNGPSNSDPASGIPYSYSTLRDEAPTRTLEQSNLFNRISRIPKTVNERLQSNRSLL